MRLAVLAAGLLLVAENAPANLVYVGGAPGSVTIVDQHPLARGDPLYDTWDVARGLYNLNLDRWPGRYDALPYYYDINNPRASLVNGGWYCTPTSGLSLVKYWANYDGNGDGKPDYPNLFRAGGPDTNSSVILEIAGANHLGRMDTDDLFQYPPGTDPFPFHRGTMPQEVRPGLFDYFNDHYANLFNAGDRTTIAGIGIATTTMEGFGKTYDTLIKLGIPVILSFPGHSTVGIGYDTTKGYGDPAHYLVNDPWDARANIAGNQVGRGWRPILEDWVLGGYDEYPSYPMDEPPMHMAWVEPVGGPGVIPEPLTVAGTLCGMAGICAYLRRRFTP
jgi:hypothetical protein